MPGLIFFEPARLLTRFAVFFVDFFAVFFDAAFFVAFFAVFFAGFFAVFFDAALRTVFFLLREPAACERTDDFFVVFFAIWRFPSNRGVSEPGHPPAPRQPPAA